MMVRAKPIPKYAGLERKHIIRMPVMIKKAAMPENRKMSLSVLIFIQYHLFCSNTTTDQRCPTDQLCVFQLSLLFSAFVSPFFSSPIIYF
jgi:hypothetical protein